MPTPNYSFEKRQRELAKRKKKAEKEAEKAARRQASRDAAAAGTDDAGTPADGEAAPE